MRDKVVCHEFRCNWHGYQKDVLQAENPFEKGVEIEGCPTCFEINCIVTACDEPGCWKEVSGGWPTKDGGYRQTCGDHHQKQKSRI